MDKESEFIQEIVRDLQGISGDQSKLDTIYDRLVEKMKKELKVVYCSGKMKGQPWFTKELMGLRKTMHRCEERWLRSVSSEQKDRRTEYLEARKVYS